MLLETALDYPTWLHPNVFPPLGPIQIGGMTLGPFTLKWYALAYIAGLMLGWRYILSLLRTPRLWGSKPAPMTPVQLDDFLFWATLGVILGGRLGYVLFYMLPSASERAHIFGDPSRNIPPDLFSIFRIWEGGMSFHGGLIGVATAIFLFSRKWKTPLLSLGDLVATATPIGLFFGRLANFVNAELYGRETDAPWAMQFPIRDIDGAIVSFTAARHPSQLYEAFLEGIVLFALLRVATHRFDSLRRPGLTAGVFLAGYGFFRFLVEFVREPDQQMPEALKQYVTMGMLLCLPMIALGAWLAWRATRPGATANA